MADALRAALAEARLAKDPRLATEELLFQVLGPDPSFGDAAGIDVDEALSQLGSLLLLSLVERIEGRWRLSRRARASPTEQPRAGPVQPVDQSSAQQLAI